jgi:hypothetical protein
MGRWQQQRVEAPGGRLRFTAHGDFMPSSPRLAPNPRARTWGTKLRHPNLLSPSGDCVVDVALRRLMEIL